MNGIARMNDDAAPEIVLFPRKSEWQYGEGRLGDIRLCFGLVQTARPTSAGLDGSRIVRLQIKSPKGEMLVLYNRGWGMGLKPWGFSEAAARIYRHILATFGA